MLPKRTAAAILAFLMMFSLGFSVYSGNGSAADVYREADMKLYENKLKLTDGQQEE